jgi:hypothetical protein
MNRFINKTHKYMQYLNNAIEWSSPCQSRHTRSHPHIRWDR